MDTIFSLGSAVLGEVVYAILLVPITAWTSVILSYTYLTYGPSPVPTATEPAGFGMAPPAPAQPPAQASTPVGASGSFCPSCGSPVSMGAKFCGACGKAI